MTGFTGFSFIEPFHIPKFNSVFFTYIYLSYGINKTVITDSSVWTALRVLNPKNELLNPKSESLNPKTEPLNPKNESLNPKIESLNPKIK